MYLAAIKEEAPSPASHQILTKQYYYKQFRIIEEIQDEDSHVQHSSCGSYSSGHLLSSCKGMSNAIPEPCGYMHG